MRFLKRKIHIIVWLVFGYLVTGFSMNFFAFGWSLLIGLVGGYFLTVAADRLIEKKTGRSFLRMQNLAKVEKDLEKTAVKVLESRGVFTDSARSFADVYMPTTEEITLRVGVPTGKESGQITALAEAFKDAFKAYAVRIKEVNPGYVDFAVFAKDALAFTGIIEADAKSGEETSVFQPVRLGIDEVGNDVNVKLYAQTVLVGGSPGSGKSGTSWALLGHAALDPNALLLVIDMKPSGIETAPIAQRANYVATTPKEANELLQQVWLEIVARNEKLLNLQLEKAPENDPDFPPIVIFCDEAAELTRAEGDDGKKALETLTRIVAVGRASGVGVVVVTQKPDSTVLPTALRDLFAQRISLRVGNSDQAKTIMGTLDEGVTPWTIAAENQGRGYIKDSFGLTRLFQGVYLERADILNMAKKAEKLHQEKGKSYELPALPVEEKTESEPKPRRRRSR